MDDTPRMGYCTKCDDYDTAFEYDKKYDAIYCKECNIWIESRCSDLNCEYCLNRPEKPLDNTENNGVL